MTYWRKLLVQNLTSSFGTKGRLRRMVEIVNVHEAKTHLSRLLDRVQGGEEIVIARSGKPVARLVAVTEQPQRRTPGSASGRVTVGPDFDAPLPEDVLEAFER